MSRPPRLVTADVEDPLREAARFVAVTFLIAAGVYLPLLASARGWIGVALPPIMAALGVASPGIASLVIRAYDDGMDGVRSTLGGLTAWRFGRVWWGVTLALPPAMAAALAAAYIGLGYDFTPEPIRLLTEAGPAALLLILLIVVLGAGEEIGWRGHLLPLLQARMTALTASLVLGVIWAVWHVPLFLQGGVEGWALPLRLIGPIAGAVMYTWLFNNTGGSVLAVSLVHAGGNIWGRLLAPAPTATPTAAIFTAENVLIALVLLVVYGGATLTHRRNLTAR